MLFVISGPTGSGKDSVINMLLKEFKNSYKVPSTVTRQQRPGEEGYRYVTKQEFLQMVSNDEFLEFVNVYGTDYYGTLKTDLKDAVESPIPVFRILDVDGYIKIKEMGIKCVSIFINVVSKDELARRIYLRGETKEDIKRRIARVDYELEKSKNYDYVLNGETLQDNLESCIYIVNKHLGKV